MKNISSDSISTPTFSRCLDSTQKKRATVVRLEIDALSRRYPMKRIVTFTLTFPDQGNLPRKDCERRFHSLCTNHLSKIFARWVVIFQRSPTGRPHYHGVAVMEAKEIDVRTGFDWEAYGLSMKAGKTWRADRSKANWAKMKQAARGYGRTAPKDLKKLWKNEFSVETMAKYGFGIAHVTPVRNGEAAAKYYARYLTQDNPSFFEFEEEDKGMRCYRVGGEGHRACNLRHMPVTKNSFKFRRKLEFAGRELGFVKYADFQEICGPRWWFHLGDEIQDLSWQYVKWKLSEDGEKQDDPVRDWYPWVVEGREQVERIHRAFFALFDERDRDIPSPNETSSFPPPGKGENEFHQLERQTQLQLN